MYYAFIQFAGFTMGKAVSQFDTPWVNYPGNNFDGLVGGGGTVTGMNQFTYTAQFGNGVSLALSAQDRCLRPGWCAEPHGSVDGSASRAAPTASNNIAGTRSPDLIAATPR